MKKEMIADKLRVYCYETRQEMGQAAASALHSKMLELLCLLYTSDAADE